MSAPAGEQTTTRHKTFTYRTSLQWSGGKAGMLASKDKPAFRVASPPEFKGESGTWTPEDLLVGAVEICHLMTFLSFAQRKQLPLFSYESAAEGFLEFLDGHYRMSRIVLSPKIVVGATVSEAEVHALLRDSHAHCIISNSINSVVEVNASVVLSSDPQD